MVQAWKPYRQFLGDSWLEKKTIPKWIALFKALGIYDQDYHKKYRHEIHNQRYKTYIESVLEDIKENIITMKKENIKECLKDFFLKKEFIIIDVKG